MAAFLVLIAIYGCKARAKSNPIPGRNTRKRIPVSNCPEKVLAARQRWFLICDSSAKSNTRNLNMRNPMRVALDVDPQEASFVSYFNVRVHQVWLASEGGGGEAVRAGGAGGAGSWYQYAAVSLLIDPHLQPDQQTGVL
eukprot:3456169-Rhodomonas_salina.6